MKRFQYSAGAGEPGRYSIFVSVDRERAARLMRHVVSRECKEVWNNGSRWFSLDIIPTEGSYAARHGARRGFLTIQLV